MLNERLTMGEVLARVGRSNLFDSDSLASSDGGAAFYAELYDAMSGVIEQFPGHAQAHFLRGVAAQGSRWYAEALTDLTEAIRLDPHHAKAFLLRSVVLASLGRYDMARADREDAIALDPKVVQ